jgi:hypothetical protein
MKLFSNRTFHYGRIKLNFLPKRKETNRLILDSLCLFRQLLKRR